MAKNMEPEMETRFLYRDCARRDSSSSFGGQLVMRRGWRCGRQTREAHSDSSRDRFGDGLHLARPSKPIS